MQPLTSRTRRTKERNLKAKVRVFSVFSWLKNLLLSGNILTIEPEIVCKATAFKHGVTLDDIRWAFSTAKYDMPAEGDEKKRLLIGFNMVGNPLEILYNELDDGRINQPRRRARTKGPAGYVPFAFNQTAALRITS